MTKRELEAIQHGVRCAQNIIEALGYENYPYGITEDRDIQEMYYELNDMLIMLSKKIQKAKN